MSTPVEPFDPLRRFSSRAGAYAKYRPSYPPEVLQFLAAECELNPYSQVADIGSGTGIFSKLLLDFGCEVIAVEPNAAMREVASGDLAGYERYRGVDGRAEQTGLAEHSVDLVVAAQAFHWFDAEAARREFARILRPPRWVAVLWNVRRTEGDAFSEGYERLLQQYGTDYKEVSEMRFQPGAFYGHDRWKEGRFDNRQEFDFGGLLGRVDSASYAPAAGSEEHTLLERELRRLFSETERGGRIAMVYDVYVYAGQLNPPV